MGQGSRAAQEPENTEAEVQPLLDLEVGMEQEEEEEELGIPAQQPEPMDGSG